MKRVWFSICKNPLLHTIFNFQKQVHIYWYCRLHCVYTVHILTANISSDVICRPTALKGRSACWRKRKKYHPLIVVSLKKAMQFLVMWLPKLGTPLASITIFISLLHVNVFGRVFFVCAAFELCLNLSLWSLERILIIKQTSWLHTCSPVLTGMCKYQNTGSNYKIKYFIIYNAKGISNMHVNLQSYWSFLRAMVNLDLHANMPTPSRVFMRLS